MFLRASSEFKDERVRNAASGIAFHWYSGNHFENIELCREKFPEKLLFHTEGCFGLTPDNPYANEYAHDIAEDLNAGTNGYIDWNILLDSKRTDLIIETINVIARLCLQRIILIIQNI